MKNKIMSLRHDCDIFFKGSYIYRLKRRVTWIGEKSVRLLAAGLFPFFPLTVANWALVVSFNPSEI